ncbi:hypothetical protein SISSUDRAFT_1033918 [Sistotremastrum suecicum HHB10207 ss-3]|uniref:Uncharacterized protein n=1 Tax=Sistotremastrum suecicum HHB10207 ss-3 TaxID=1314776 RepID=A0A166CPB3_9AGAM|nr:hypothetical protein SISSUDRAFT_1033918 [Sistotremastrum suecicum HHB10207 ss-3]
MGTSVRCDIWYSRGQSVQDYPAEAIKPIKAAFKFMLPTRSTPGFKAQSPLDKLTAIRFEFISFTSSFFFPTTFVFHPASPSLNLASNLINAAFHCYDESLMKLRSMIDTVERDGVEETERSVTSTVPGPVKGCKISYNTSEVTKPVACTSIPVAEPDEASSIVSEAPQERVSAPFKLSSTPDLDNPVPNPSPAILSSETPLPSSSISSHVEPAAVDPGLCSMPTPVTGEKDRNHPRMTFSCMSGLTLVVSD